MTDTFKPCSLCVEIGSLCEICVCRKEGRYCNDCGGTWEVAGKQLCDCVIGYDPDDGLYDLEDYDPPLGSFTKSASKAQYNNFMIS